MQFSSTREKSSYGQSARKIGSAAFFETFWLFSFFRQNARIETRKNNNNNKSGNWVWKRNFSYYSVRWWWQTSAIEDMKMKRGNSSYQHHYHHSENFVWCEKLLVFEEERCCNGESWFIKLITWLFQIWCRMNSILSHIFSQPLHFFSVWNRA